MKLCFPVLKDEGMESTVYNHFGSAPMFVVIDTVTNNISTIVNRDQHHQHGACNPIKALDDKKIDAIVVGGIGRGALTRLNQSAIRVFLTCLNICGTTINIRFSIVAVDTQVAAGALIKNCPLDCSIKKGG